MSPQYLTRRALAGLAVAALSAGALTACSSDSDDAKKPAGDGHALTVVASTSVYADIAKAVAGDKAQVSAIIADPAADPHSYESSPADAARIKGASLVVFNGAGYDEFVDKALETGGPADPVKAVDEFASATGVTVETHEHGDDKDGAKKDDHKDGDHKDGDKKDSDKKDEPKPGGRTTDNEHVWYSLPAAAAVARAIAERLGKLDSADAATFTANAAAFGRKLDPLRQKLEALKASPAGGKPASYVQTEPIGMHMFDTAGLSDSTPAGFTHAIESDTDPSAADLDAASKLLTEHKVSFLALNTQTETPLTTRLRDTAKSAGLPVVELTETLPAGTDYVGWMTANVEHTLAAAAHPAG